MAAFFAGVAFFLSAAAAAFLGLAAAGLVLVTRPDFVFPRTFFSSAVAPAASPAAFLVVVRLAPVFDFGLLVAGLAFVVVAFLVVVALAVLGLAAAGVFLVVAAFLVVVPGALAFLAAGFFSDLAASFFASLMGPDVPVTDCERPEVVNGRWVVLLQTGDTRRGQLHEQDKILFSHNIDNGGSLKNSRMAKK